MGLVRPLGKQLGIISQMLRKLGLSNELFSVMMVKNKLEREGLSMRPMKKVSDSLTEQQYLICPGHINHYGRLVGGNLLKWIDELAGIVAIRHSGGIVYFKVQHRLLLLVYEHIILYFDTDVKKQKV
jgi:hypothetical protein